MAFFTSWRHQEKYMGQPEQTGRTHCPATHPHMCLHGAMAEGSSKPQSMGEKALILPATRKLCDINELRNIQRTESIKHHSSSYAFFFFNCTHLFNQPNQTPCFHSKLLFSVGCCCFWGNRDISKEPSQLHRARQEGHTSG